MGHQSTPGECEFSSTCTLDNPDLQGGATSGVNRVNLWIKEEGKKNMGRHLVKKDKKCKASFFLGDAVSGRTTEQCFSLCQRTTNCAAFSSGNNVLGAGACVLCNGFDDDKLDFNVDTL